MSDGEATNRGSVNRQTTATTAATTATDQPTERTMVNGPRPSTLGPSEGVAPPSSPSGGLTSLAATLKEAYKKTVATNQQSIETSPTTTTLSGSPQCESSPMPAALRTLYFRDASYALGKATAVMDDDDEDNALPPAPPIRLSPKDVIINRGKRKRQDSLNLLTMSTDFMKQQPRIPAQADYLRGAPSSSVASAVATGQMMMDPHGSKNFVPNDIFVQALGPDGVLPDLPPAKKHSQYRGVTKHRRSGRWEAHIWLKTTGKQMYLGAYENEAHAAEAYDVAALKIKGEAKAKLNFAASKYAQYVELLDTLTLAELVKTVKSRVPPRAPRVTKSNYRGVTWSVKRKMWEAKYKANFEDASETSLGFFEDDAEAAKVFDAAVIKQHGQSAAINFDLKDYPDDLLAYHTSQLNRLGSASPADSDSEPVPPPSEPAEAAN